MDSTPTNSRRKSRLSRPFNRACIVCHSRKVKCDGSVNGFPCANCRSTNVECLVSTRRQRKRPAPGSSVLRPEPPADECINVAEASNFSTIPEATSAAPDCHEGRDQSSDTFAAATSDELAKQHLVEFFRQNLQSAPIQSRLAYVGNSLSNLYHLVRQRSPNHLDVHHYPCSNVNISPSRARHQRATGPALIPEDAFVLPPRHISDVLIANYFTHVHPGFPIVDKDQFLRSYQAENSSVSILLLQSVCLVGSHVSDTFKNRQDLKAAFFRRAKTLFNARYEEDRMNMVQAALLLTWFSDGGDDVCANAWWWIGLAARTAIGLGMHRDVSQSNMPENDKRTWRRIWWCLVQFDCLVSLFYGRPQNINLDNCDVPHLRVDDFDSSTSNQQASFAVHHAKLCALVSELTQLHFSVRASKSQARARIALDAVDTALVDWYLDLPAEFRKQEKRQGQDSSIWNLLLYLTYNTLLIQIHRPFVDAENLSEDTYSARSNAICAEASSNIIEIFEKLAADTKLQYCWFWAPSALFAAMLHFSEQMNGKSRILAIKANEKYESGLVSFRELAKYWLFAASIARLFQSNLVLYLGKEAQHDRASLGSNSHPLEAHESRPGITSPIEATPAAHASAQTTDGEQGQYPNTSWLDMISNGDLGTGSIYVDNNRWSSSMVERQPIYWNDPIASMIMEDNTTGLQSWIL